MPRPPKVVPITEVVPSAGKKPRLIAQDEQTQRLIIGIGQQRIAFDVTTRITHLPPNTGDQPAAVLPLQTRSAGDHTLTPKRSGSRKGSRGKRPGERKKPN